MTIISLNSKKQLTKTIVLPKKTEVILINSNLQFLYNQQITKTFEIHKSFQIQIQDSQLYLSFDYGQLKYSLKQAKMIFKTQVVLLENFLYGLQQNYKLKLNLIGVGFKFSIIDSYLYLKVGYSHEIKVLIPSNISIVNVKSTQLILYSSDWNDLTNFVALIKRIKPIEPYNGKGIQSENEKYVHRKTSKKDKNKK